MSVWKTILNNLPEVEGPSQKHLSFKEKLKWTIIVLMIFFTNYGFEHVKTSIASNILTLEMFFAVLIGFLFFREIPSLKEIFGGVLILFSVIQMNKLE